MTRTATADDVKSALAELADPDDAVQLQRFFKTGPGQYGEGDAFIGVRVPQIRVVAKRFATLALGEVGELLDSGIHEHRLAGLIILNRMFLVVGGPSTGDPGLRQHVAEFYLEAVRRGRVNNWDLVDASAEFVLGEFLWENGPRDVLFELARSESLWERRVAVLSSFAFIKHGDASTTLQLAELLLSDREDLMQKAVGWMLREVGKRVDRAELVAFLEAHAPRMPRTMLSYATEHLTPAERADYRGRR